MALDVIWLDLLKDLLLLVLAVDAYLRLLRINGRTIIQEELAVRLRLINDPVGLSIQGFVVKLIIQLFIELEIVVLILVLLHKLLISILLRLLK